MLYKYSTENIKYNFLDRAKEARKSRNVFTIIVGKNGTGKSRLLRDISVDFLHSQWGRQNYVDVTFRKDLNQKGKAHFTDGPTKLICVSTSPFDKFPLLKKSESASYYSYLGLRGLTTVNMGLAYIARIIYTLADAASQSETHSRAIGDVLEYLNYEPVINVTFGPAFQSFLPSLGNPPIFNPS